MPDPRVPKLCDRCHTVTEVPMGQRSCDTCGTAIFLHNRSLTGTLSLAQYQQEA